MVSILPRLIKEQCRNFVLNYEEEDIGLLNKFTHDKKWKEDDEKLEEITTNICNIM
jgi:hypothetical protein